MRTATAVRNAGWTLEAVMAELEESVGASDETESGDVLERAWRDHTKYVCAICERFHAVDNREEVERHIERQH